jgi:hypothetical protein
MDARPASKGRGGRVRLDTPGSAAGSSSPPPDGSDDNGLEHPQPRRLGQAHFLAASATALAVLFAAQLWMQIDPAPPPADDPDETIPPIAELTVRPLLIDGQNRFPTWRELFVAYQIETEFRDTSIICAARGRREAADTDVDQQLEEGQRVRMYLHVDPNCGRAPKPRARPSG